MKLSDIEDAFLFVNSAPYGEHIALVCHDGRILYRSEVGDLDEISDEDLDDVETIEIPNKNDLDLGQRLVYRFVEFHAPDLHEQVRRIFARRGAYSRFKELLASKDLLEAWYDFENKEQQKALRRWCQDNEIELDD